MNKLFKWSATVAAALALAGCGAGEETNTTDASKTTVYTTVYPLQYFTEQIGGDLVEVKTIYPPGADEHSYEPSQKDMMNLADSDLFFYVGLGLEGFVEKATTTLENEHVTMVPVGESIHFEESSTETTESHDHEDESADSADTHDHEDESTDSADTHDHEDESTGSGDSHDHGDIDPHVWLDPLYSIEMAEAIKNELVQKLPEDEEELEANFNKLEKELQELHQEFLSATSDVEHKEFLVSHAAFGYWEQRYGLEQISVAGLSSSNEPSQKELETIIETANEHEIHYIFFEQNVSSKLTEIVQNEIGAESLTLHNLSVLNEDDIEKGRDYFSIMRDNIEALQTSFTH